jgi:hypothetical protein
MLEIITYFKVIFNEIKNNYSFLVEKYPITLGILLINTIFALIK